jgi:hypothetical protein
MTNSLSGDWVGDETDDYTGYEESWRLDELDELDDDDDDDEDGSADRSPQW